MSTSLKKLAPRRSAVRGYLDQVRPNEVGYYAVRDKPQYENSIPAIVADASVWKAVPKIRSKGKSKILYGYSFIYHDRILFNGNGAISVNTSDTIPSRKKVLIAETKFYRLVKKSNVKPLKPVSKTGVPTPHQTHRMSKWRTEVRNHCGTARFHAVRHCSKCEADQSSHPAGKFSDIELTKPCQG